jgi:hypothetical protein
MAKSAKINASDFCNSILQCGLPQTPLMLWEVKLPDVPKPPINQMNYQRPKVIIFIILSHINLK